LILTDRRALDLSRPDSVATVLDRLAPELMINTAAYTAVDKAEDEKELAWLVNAEAPGIMARWAAERRVPLIHFSTDYVFDGSGDRPWREGDRPAPVSIYGKSKLGGEEAIRRAGGDTLIVRTSWVYAAKGTNFLRTIARLARERPELRVVDDQIGAPTPAVLVAVAVAQML
jgi:dTDP-4-dehydrorhamnose reductase